VPAPGHPQIRGLDFRGFNMQDDVPDLFVLHSNINMPGFRSLPKGARVTFEIEQGQKGPTAVNVTLI
jgi:CspA family cold shock protein